MLGRLLLVLALTFAGAAVGFADPPSDYALLDAVRRGRVLREGSSGADVAALQRALTAVGLPVTATGYFGPMTRGLVLRLQREQGCAVDGLVGQETLAALDRLLGATTPAPPVTLRRLTNAEVTPAISAEAVRILRQYRDQPFGFEVPFTADGREYVGRIERHYHPPGGAARPWGYHKGVSVLAVVR